MRPTVTFVARSICIIMSVVYLLVTTVSPAKMDEPIDMSFAVWTLGAQATKYRSRWVYAAKETGGGGLTKKPARLQKNRLAADYR